MAIYLLRCAFTVKFDAQRSKGYVAETNVQTAYPCTNSSIHTQRTPSTSPTEATCVFLSSNVYRMAIYLMCSAFTVKFDAQRGKGYVAETNVQTAYPLHQQQHTNTVHTKHIASRGCLRLLNFNRIKVCMLEEILCLKIIYLCFNYHPNYLASVT